MALDDANKRLFVGCRFPARLVVLDRTSGRIVTSLPTVGDTDDVFYDPVRRLVYVIGGEGAVEVLRQHDQDHYEPARRITTAPGARTGLFVPAFNRLFVAVPHRGLQSARVLVYEVKETNEQQHCKEISRSDHAEEAWQHVGWRGAQVPRAASDDAVMLCDSMAGLVLVTAASNNRAGLETIALNESNGTIRTYSKKWMITSFTPGKMAINAAAPIIAHPAYRMACA
jgi:hypothetical protein